MDSRTGYHCSAVFVFGVLLCVAQTTAQYTPAPRDYAAHRFLLDDGTGGGFSFRRSYRRISHQLRTGFGQRNRHCLFPKRHRVGH